MNAAISAVGATSVRWPAASSTMASLTGPNGLSSQRPTTIRVPEVVPSPAMWPVKAYVVIVPPSRRTGSEPSPSGTEAQQRHPCGGVVEDADHREPDTQT